MALRVVPCVQRGVYKSILLIAEVKFALDLVLKVNKRKTGVLAGKERYECLL